MAEELKQKAKDFIDRINKESGGNWLDKYYLTDLLVMFATEATNELNYQKQARSIAENAVVDLTKENAELKAQIEKMKLCANCKHCGVSGWCNELNGYLLDKANQCCGNWEIKEK